MQEIETMRGDQKNKTKMYTLKIGYFMHETKTNAIFKNQQES